MRTRTRPILWTVLVGAVLSLVLPLLAGVPAQAAPPRLLYRTHVDAAHIAWENDGLKIKVIDGQTPVPADSVTVRLGPDADTDGQETSRLQVPNSPELSFLGAPGEIVWHSPAVYNRNWSPVWAGFGTGKFPNEVISAIYPERTQLHLRGVEGPGTVHVYSYDSVNDKTSRMFSSNDTAYRDQFMAPGAHVHANWAFSKPGKYVLTWQGSTKKRDGTTLESAPTTVTWLVGPDSVVGLPKGTTTRSPITSFIGGTPPQDYDGPTPPSTPSPTTTTSTPSPTKPSTSPTEPLVFNPTKGKVCTHVTAGRTTFRAGWNGTVLDSGYPSEPDVSVNQADGSALRSYHGVVDLPDTAKSTAPEDAAFNKRVPAGSLVYRYAGQPSAPGPFMIDNRDITSWNLLREGSLVVDSVEGPDGGVMAIGHREGEKFVLDAIGNDGQRYPIRATSGSESPHEILFSKPGFYSVSMTYFVHLKKTLPSGEFAQNYKDFTLIFAVGDEAMSHACQRTPSGTPTATTTPTTSPTSPLAQGGIVIDKGHVDVFDVAPAADGGLALRLKEDVTGHHVVRRPEDVTLVVKEKALTDIPSGWPGHPKAYLLPLSQNHDLLWPGWDTSSVQAAGLSKVSIEVMSIDGPGPVQVFSQTWDGKPAALTEDKKFALPATIVNEFPAHTHAYWAFGSLGTYTIQVRAYVEKDGKRVESNTAKYTWVVGEANLPSPSPTTSNPTTSVPPTPPTSTPTSPPSTPSPTTTSPEPTSTSSPPQPGPTKSVTTLEHGHIDMFNVVAESGKLDLNLKEDVTGSGVIRQPEDVLLVVKEAALTTTPQVGLPIDGQRAYILPETQDPALLWPGWNTMQAQGTVSATNIEILSVDGPGTIYLSKSTGLSGEQRSVLSNGSFSLPGTIIVPDNAHVHANWFFTKPGTYTVKAKASGIALVNPNTTAGYRGLQLATAPLSTAEKTWTISVGDASSPGAPSAPGSTPPGGTGENPPATVDPGLDPTTGPLLGDTGASVAPSGKQQDDNSCLPTKIMVPVDSAPRGGSPNSAVSRANSGHFDMGAEVSGGRLVPKIKDDRTQPANWVSPESLLFDVGGNAKKSAPAGMGFIASAGEPIWVIGSTQEAGVPWLGQNTMHPSLIEQTTGSVTWTLDRVDGPGKLAIFNSGALGGGVGTRVLDNVGGPTNYTVPANTHAHPNWVFSAPGAYQVRITQSAELKNGQKISGTATLSFAVGEASTPVAAIAPASMTEPAGTPRMIEKTVGRTKDGKPCALPGQRLSDTGVGTTVPAISIGVSALFLGLGLVLWSRRGRSIRTP